MPLSFQEIEEKISIAAGQIIRPPMAYPDSTMMERESDEYIDFYVAAVYPTEAILRLYKPGQETFYKVPYELVDGQVQLADRETWQEAERAWVAKSLAAINPLKSVSKTDDWLRVANHIIMFGERDLSSILKYDPFKKSFSINPQGRGEYFTKSTLLDSPYTATGVLHIDVEHGLGRLFDGPDAPGEDDIIGYVDWKTAKVTQKGVWVEQALNRRNQYVQSLEKLIDMGLMGTSSEAVPELVKINKNGEITQWGLKRNTLSFMPADPRMMADNAITALKSLAERFPGLKAILPQDAGDASGAGDAPETIPPTKSTNFAIPKESNIMGENTQTQDPNARLDALEAAMNKFSKGIETITTALEKMPALNAVGYKTDDGGKADPTHKSLGDFLLAVKRNDETRLKSVYGSRKDISGETGESGGWLAPEDQGGDLLRISAEVDPIMSRVDVVPVSAPAGKWPALDMFVAPTAGSGNTALAGGVTAAKTAAGVALTETQPTFAELSWRLNKVGGYVEVENEIGNDAPMLEALLRSLFAIAIGAKNHRNVLRGSGVGEPLGILNADCAVAVTTATDNVFKYADSLNMLAHFKSVGGQPVWIMHPGVLPDVGVMEIGTAGAGAVFLANGGNGSPMTLHSYPILVSEHMPQANGDDVILADLKAYKFWMNRAGLSIAFSEHAAFTTDKGTWRFTQRNDGKPWLKNKITLADPTGSYYVSPFVYHDD